MARIPKKFLLSLLAFILICAAVYDFSKYYGYKGSVRSANVTSIPTVTRSITPTPSVTAALATTTVTPTNISTGKYKHIFVYVLENKSSGQVIGSASFLTSLANTYLYLDNYQNILHPSLPNYLALTSGSNYGVSTDCESCYLNVNNIGNLMSEKGISWKGYMESMPSNCFIGSSYPYAQKHDPFIYFDDIRNSSTCKTHVVEYSQLQNDLNTNNAPAFSFITPNLCNDMHDCPVSTGDAWMRQSVSMVMNSEAYKDNGLIIVTFDESESNGNIATILVSQNIKKEVNNSAYNHYSTLKFIEDNFNLPYLGNSASANSIVVK